MEIHASGRIPALSIAAVTAMALVIVMGTVAIEEWLPLPPGGSGPAARSVPGLQSSPRPAAGTVCGDCGTVESVRRIEKGEIIAGTGVVVRGFGDELMSVIAAVAGAATGRRFAEPETTTAIQEVTIHFEDGSSRVVKSIGGRSWERGDRVRVSYGRIQADG